MTDIIFPWITGILSLFGIFVICALFVAIIGLQNFLITLILFSGIGVLPYLIGKCITGFFK